MSEASTPAQVLELYRKAWDAGDASAFGELFTEDATYVIFTGHALLGREQIRNNHHEVFTKWQRGTSLLAEALQTTMLDGDTAVILTQGGIGTGNIEFDKFQTFTLVRREERWFIAAFQNTEMARRKA